MSFDKLKGKMVEKRISQAVMADMLGITLQSLNSKLNGRTQFNLGEVVKISSILKIKDVRDIFFENNIPNMQQKGDE